MIRIGSILTLIFVLSYAGVSIWYGRLEENLIKKPVSKKEVVSTTPVEKTEIVRQPDDYTIIVKRFFTAYAYFFINCIQSICISITSSDNIWIT